MSADLPRLTDAERETIERAVCTLGKIECQVLGHKHTRHLNRLIPAVEQIIAAHTPDAATEPAPGLQAGSDGASGVARRPEPDAGDVDALADWLGGQVEAGNVTDYTDEQTTWIEVGVDDLAHRIVASDWLTARDAARAQGAAEALREAADWTQEYAWQPGDGHMVAEDEQAAYMLGAHDAHAVASRLLRVRADRIAGQDGGGQ